MRDNCSDLEIEEAIRASMKMTDIPDPELNQKIKAALYRQEAVLRITEVSETWLQMGTKSSMV